MKGENFNISDRKPRVLVAPLDWGLGHATRCIPLIHELLALNCDVMIGAEGAVKNLLEKEFAQLIFLPLKEYEIKYSHKKSGLSVKILLQLPKIIRRIYHEHRWLKKIIIQNNIDAIISDNRFGLYSTMVPCIYITHQLTIITGNHFFDWIAQKINYHFINKYNACWIPDAIDENNLAGILSHPKHLPQTPAVYLGPLSRFEKITVEKKYDLAVILSGPEPQRTFFEDLLLKQLENYTGTCLFVRGLPADVQQLVCENVSIDMHNHLSSTTLNKAILQSEWVISRSGYTTVMDLVKLQQKAILIPTPGQTEQEYLAEILMKKNIFYCIKQEEFSLHQDLKKAAGFSFTRLVLNPDEYKMVIENFVTNLPAAIDR